MKSGRGAVNEDLGQRDQFPGLAQPSEGTGAVQAGAV